MVPIPVVAYKMNGYLELDIDSGVWKKRIFRTPGPSRPSIVKIFRMNDDDDVDNVDDEDNRRDVDRRDVVDGVETLQGRRRLSLDDDHNDVADDDADDDEDGRRGVGRDDNDVNEDDKHVESVDDDEMIAGQFETVFLGFGAMALGFSLVRRRDDRDVDEDDDTHVETVNDEPRHDDIDGVDDLQQLRDIVDHDRGREDPGDDVMADVGCDEERLDDIEEVDKDDDTHVETVNDTSQRQQGDVRMQIEVVDVEQHGDDVDEIRARRDVVDDNSDPEWVIPLAEQLKFEIDGVDDDCNDVVRHEDNDDLEFIDADDEHFTVSAAGCPGSSGSNLFLGVPILEGSGNSNLDVAILAEVKDEKATEMSFSRGREAFSTMINLSVDDDDDVDDEEDADDDVGRRDKVDDDVTDDFGAPITAADEVDDDDVDDGKQQQGVDDEEDVEDGGRDDVERRIVGDNEDGAADFDQSDQVISSSGSSSRSDVFSFLSSRLKLVLADGDVGRRDRVDDDVKDGSGTSKFAADDVGRRGAADDVDEDNDDADDEEDVVERSNDEGAQVDSADKQVHEEDVEDDVGQRLDVDDNDVNDDIDRDDDDNRCQRYERRGDESEEQYGLRIDKIAARFHKGSFKFMEKLFPPRQVPDCDSSGDEFWYLKDGHGKTIFFDSLQEAQAHTRKISTPSFDGGGTASTVDKIYIGGGLALAPNVAPNLNQQDDVAADDDRRRRDDEAAPAQPRRRRGRRRRHKHDDD